MHENERYLRVIAWRCGRLEIDSLSLSRPNCGGTVLSGVVAIGLLGACAGPQRLPPAAAEVETSRQSVVWAAHDERAYDGILRAARAAVAGGKPQRMRPMAARRMASEWGAWQPGYEPYSSVRALSGRPRRDGASLPSIGYSLSIQEIMANATCHSCEDKPYHQLVMLASNLHGVPASLIHAVIQKESSYNPAASSRQHARGLMQITPGTGKYMGVANSQKLYDPQTNINAGTAYLKYLMSAHDTVDKVLAAYNAGPGNVRKYNGVPPFNETRRYVRDVKTLYAYTSKAQ